MIVQKKNCVENLSTMDLSNRCELCMTEKENLGAMLSSSFKTKKICAQLTRGQMEIK